MQALVLNGNFNHPKNCGRDNRAGHKQFRRLLEYIGDKFQIKEPAGGCDLPGPEILNKEQLVRDVKVGGSLGMVEFRILRR